MGKGTVYWCDMEWHIFDTKFWRVQSMNLPNRTLFSMDDVRKLISYEDLITDTLSHLRGKFSKCFIALNILINCLP